MDRNVRYEVLRTDEESEVEEGAVAPSAPPAAGGAVEPSGDTVVLIPANPDTEGAALKLPEPPSYNIATSLPSYEEAEQTKQTEDAQRQREADTRSQSQSSLTNNAQKIGDLYLGTDSIFICSFLLAFLFNCIGLFAILCVSQTVAARFGAVAGFGLSIVKYAALMKYPNSEWAGLWENNYPWLWWFMLFLGLLMFFRGCLQYIRVKNQWHKLSQQTRGRIFLYF